MLTQTEEKPIRHAATSDRVSIFIKTSAVIVGLGVVAMTGVIFVPMLSGRASVGIEKTKAAIPAYNYEIWHPLAVQQGRTKPFETFAIELVRQITGRAKFEGNDPVAVVLSWILTAGHSSEQAFTNWETYPFILCEHEGLRAKIYEHLGDAAEREKKSAGKYVAPADLRSSPGFEELIRTAAAERQKDPEKAHFHLSSAQMKAEEVARRLAQFDGGCGRATSPLFHNALLDGQYIDLQEQAEILDKSPAAVLAYLEKNRLRKHPDPFHFVALDRVPDSAWFSVGEMRAAQANDQEWQDFWKGAGKQPMRSLWQDYMQERLTEMPQRYISPERMQSLREFQEQIKAGQGQQAIDELKGILQQRRDEKIKEFEEAQQAKHSAQLGRVVHQIVKTTKDEQRLLEIRDRAARDNTPEAQVQKAILQELRQILQDADEAVIKQLQQGLALTQTKHYVPEEPEFRMMHLGYLESRFPNVYKESLAAQKFPAETVALVLASFHKLQQAYMSGDAGKFEQASKDFFQVVHQTSDRTLIDGLAERNPTEAVAAAYEQVKKARAANDAHQLARANVAFLQAAREDGSQFYAYPGVDTLSLEMLYNHTQPFMWAWMVMLAGVVSLITSMAWRSRYWYLVGFAFYLASLAVQSFGFFARIVISGRPPVSDMYETVIWVAFMSAIFALILELIYRRKVILLGGALMSFFGLVLADQLPLALDPTLKPLVPVLRSNLWLTIHVLTIVSSYAAGTLAWAVGNLSLALLAFGKGKRETLKMLSLFTYRALQIAVLLLAAGTFLGGWWAAYSWGRFWGWDSKEVGALIALVCYVIPLHARYAGWVKDYGLAVCAVLCYSFIMFSWYGINFIIAAGLHSYGFGGGGGTWVGWAGLLNIEWVLIASLIYRKKLQAGAFTGA